jgi:hypothetical protein
MRSSDVLTVTGGQAASHRFYFDQMAFAEQLGLAPEAKTSSSAPEGNESFTAGGS